MSLEVYIQKTLKATRACVTAGYRRRAHEIFHFPGFYAALIRCGTTSWSCVRE